MCVYVCACARLLMPDIIFQRLILSQFCIGAPGKKKTKEKCSVYSTRASPLLPHSCLMLKDHAAFKQGFWRCLLQSRDQQCGEEALEIKRETSGCQEGCAPGLKGLGKASRWKCWHWWPQGQPPIFDMHCRRLIFFFQKEPHSLQNPPSANSIPAGTQPPAASALATPPPPIPGKIQSQYTNYRLSWEKSTWDVQIILKSFYLFLFQLKNGCPQKKEICGPAVTRNALCNVGRGAQL